LPLVSGLEVLRELKPHETGLPVIMVSSQSSIKTVQEAINLGAIGFVIKHGPKEDALEAIREALATLDEPADDE
jgi:DNA-binding NarL/FixJ family response regulator